jgi:hydroxyethylthiazole kinase-like uncharacterized protein yjeF
MLLWTAEEAQTADRRAQELLGLSSEAFIEQAAQRFVESLQKEVLDDFSQPIFLTKVLVLVGPGNNGADGLSIARKLEALGLVVQLWFYSGMVPFPERKEFSLVIDAIFGVGFSRELKPQIADSFRRWNQHRKTTGSDCRIIAVDIPSGLNATTGWAQPVALRADMTITFGKAKLGLVINQGPLYCGKLRVVDIGFPQALMREMAHEKYALGANTARSFLPRRNFLGNKGSFGTVMVCAGSVQFPGAALLCSRAAFRSGVGYVYVLKQRGLESFTTLLPESIPVTEDDFSDIVQKNCVWLVGPGLRSDFKYAALFEFLIANQVEKVLIDASAIRPAADYFSGKQSPKSWVWTPHPGEAARILGAKVGEIQQDRVHAVRELSRRFGGVFVLKGYRSLIAQEDTLFVNLSGNASLAKAGSGDVLSGIIAGFLAQSRSVLLAVAAAVYTHGAVADRWVRSGKDGASLQPSDLIDHLPETLALIRSKKLFASH